MAVGASPARSSSAHHLHDLRKNMTVAEKVAQITQLDIMEILDYEAAKDGFFKLDDSKLAKYVKAGVGSFLNSPTAGGSIGKLSVPDAGQWRNAMHHLRRAFEDAGKVILSCCYVQAGPLVSAVTCAQAVKCAQPSSIAAILCYTATRR
jgi:hypothetical protein